MSASKGCKDLARPPPQLAPLDAAGTGGQAPRKDVFRDRYRPRERELLKHHPDPERLRSCREAIATGTPCSLIVPPSGDTVPERMPSSVDLPAPFSPTSAWTSPRSNSRDTSSRARVVPNNLPMPVSSRNSALINSPPASPCRQRRYRRSRRNRSRGYARYGHREWRWWLQYRDLECWRASVCAPGTTVSCGAA